MDDDQFQQPGAADELPSLEDEVKSVERKLRSSGADKKISWLSGYNVGAKLHGSVRDPGLAT